MEMSNNVDLLTPAWVWLCDTGPRCWLAVLSVLASKFWYPTLIALVLVCSSHILCNLVF